MTKIITDHIYLDNESNDNFIAQRPIFDGLKFMGYEVIRKPVYGDDAVLVNCDG